MILQLINTKTIGYFVPSRKDELIGLGYTGCEWVFEERNHITK